MGIQISNYLLLMILVLVVAGQVKVEGAGTCSEPLGACGPIGNCDQRCKARHIGGQAQGSCDLQLCTCYYSCKPGPSPGPPTVKKCNAALGVCSFQCNDACCNSKCASQFNQGTGYCSNAGTGVSVCTCQYACGDF